MRYDVVVVGGGPAGASCARVLSEKGAKVLLIERKKLPRFKLCAGCLSARIETYLPKGWRSEVLNEIKGGILGFRGERFFEKTAQRAVAYIVDRSSFDHFLVREAVKNGVELWEETEFIGFEEDQPLIIRTSKGEVLADFLIGADGFYTRVGKQLGYKKEKFFRSVEFWSNLELEDKVIIDIGIVKRGYGWIFPKGNRVSIGLATTGKENTLKVLKEYVRRHRYIEGVEIENVKGWMIPFITEKGDVQLGKGRVLLTGDAANLVDPLLGEGIYYGVLSGIKVGKAISENPERAFEIYSLEVHRDIVPELLYAGKIANLAYRFQRIAFRMGGGYAMDRFLKLLTGEMNYKELYRKGLGEFFIYLLHFENFFHIIIDKISRRR